jgi:nitrilase
VHGPTRRTWGHSMVLDPWGRCLGCREDSGPGVILASLDRALLEETRASMPLLSRMPWLSPCSAAEDSSS